MTGDPLRIPPAYSMWPVYNRRLHDIVAGSTEERLGTPTGYRQWPMCWWATLWD
jgi:hypothetical protein